MNNNRLVSVIISTHNRCSFLHEAVRSVLDQTFTDFELIICDDASGDATPSVCDELEQLDPRVRTLRHDTNLGMVGNWNSGLAASRGRYFVKLDDDNCFLPSFLEKTVDALQAAQEASYAFTDEWFVDTNRNRDEGATQTASEQYGRARLTAGLHKNSAALALQQSPGLNSSLFVRQVLIKAGGFKASAGSGADAEIFLNLASSGCACCYIKERLLEYRVHEGSDTATLADRVDQAEATIRILQSLSFGEEAECLRRRKLSGSHIWLSRALALRGDFHRARHELRQARLLTPVDPKTLLISSVLSLPLPVLRQSLRLRYGDRFQQPSAAVTFVKDE